MQDPLLDRLRRDGLLKRAFVQRLEQDRDEDSGSDPSPTLSRPPPPHLVVLRLCEQGALEGGLSVAFGVRPDELIGPLCQAVGGSAKKLRVLDVREHPVLELRIQYGDLEESWEIEDLYTLVQNLNDLLEDDRSARAVAILGEWEDALQLWCVRKDQLRQLLTRDYFAPRNRHQLEAISGRRDLR